jgi:hypothetical protein
MGDPLRASFFVRYGGGGRCEVGRSALRALFIGGREVAAKQQKAQK